MKTLWMIVKSFYKTSCLRSREIGFSEIAQTSKIKMVEICVCELYSTGRLNSEI